MLCFLTFFSSFHCSSVAHHSDPRVLSPVPLLPNSPRGPPPSRRVVRSEAQVQGYQRRARPCSQRHDLSLRRSRGAALCPSNTDVCLLTVVPTFPGLLEAPVSCLLVWSFQLPSAVSDQNKNRQSSSSCPLILIFSTCRFWALVAMMPLTVAATESGWFKWRARFRKKIMPTWFFSDDVKTKANLALALRRGAS